MFSQFMAAAHYKCHYLNKAFMYVCMYECMMIVMMMMGRWRNRRLPGNAVLGCDVLCWQNAASCTNFVSTQRTASTTATRLERLYWPPTEVSRWRHQWRHPTGNGCVISQLLFVL